MKRLIEYGVVALLLMLGATSCYDPIVKDYTYTAAYFSQQQPLRTTLADRDPSDENVISVGAAIGGRLEVNIDDWARFVVNEDLLYNKNLYPNGTGLRLMPENYYELADESLMVVSRENNFIVDVDITFTDDFYADPKAVDSYYAIPFELVSSSCDSIISTKYYSIVAMKYQSKYHGTYYVQGYTAEMSDYDRDTDVKEFSGSAQQYNKSDLSQNVTSDAKTVGRYTVSRAGQTVVIGNKAVDNGAVNITVDPETNEVEVTAADGNTNFYEGSGSGSITYDDDTQECVIKIVYVTQVSNVYYYIDETLTRRQDPKSDLRGEFWTEL